MRLAAALLVLCVPRVAAAYCYAANCKVDLPNGERGNGSVCVPPGQIDAGYPLVNPACEGGVPLFWRRSCVGFALHEGGSLQVSTKKAAELVREAFLVWTDASCAQGRPNIRVEDLGEVVCDRAEYNPEGANVNLITFRDADWPYDPNALGKTTVSYDIPTGEIFDSDIEINSTPAVVLQTVIPPSWAPAPECANLGPVPECLQYDLASILTHEAGHFLGMAHSPVTGATMFYSVGLFDLEARTLAADDVAGICALYPPGPADPACNPIPRHGFSPYCFDAQVEGDCSLSRTPVRGTSIALFMLLVALAFARRP